MKFNAKSQSKLAEAQYTDVTVLSDTEAGKKVTMSIKRKGVDRPRAEDLPPNRAGKCDEDEPSD